MSQETPRSLSEATDILVRAKVHPATSKERPSNNGKINDHLSGLFRVGRVMTSIFDRGRHLKYDYRVVSSQYHTRDDKTSKPTSPYTTATVQSSRASSMATLSQADSNTSSAASSRRGSSESVKKARRGAMSIS